jgi:hypothetical protein
MAMLSRISDFIYRLPPKKLALWLFAIMLLRTGVWCMGSFPEQLTVTVDPFANHFQFTPSHYVFWNYLGPLIAHGLFWLMPLNSVAAVGAGYFIYSLVFSLLATVLFCKLVIQRFEADDARAALIVYFTLPIAATSFYWVGMDGLTQLLLLLPFVFPQSWLFGAGIGLLLGLQHFEQGFVAYAAVLLSLLIAQKPGVISKRNVLGVLGGVVTGKILLAAWFALIHLKVETDRVKWFTDNMDSILGYLFLHIHYVYASLFGIGWLAVMKFTEMKGERLAFFLPLAALLLLPIVVEDETRVFALTSFPLVTAWLLLNPAFLKKLDRTMLSLMAVLLVITPYLWVWRGVPRWSALPYDILWLSHQFTGMPKLPEDLFRWAFAY